MLAARNSDLGAYFFLNRNPNPINVKQNKNIFSFFCMDLCELSIHRDTENQAVNPSTAYAPLPDLGILYTKILLQYSPSNGERQPNE